MKRRIALWLSCLSVRLGGDNPDQLREELRNQIHLRTTAQAASKDVAAKLYQVEECCYLIMRNAIRYQASRDSFTQFGEGTNHFVQHLWDRARRDETAAKPRPAERDITPTNREMGQLKFKPRRLMDKQKNK